MIDPNRVDILAVLMIGLSFTRLACALSDRPDEDAPPDDPHAEHQRDADRWHGRSA